MATEKRININFSSLIDLKAELFKKQEALKAEKLRREFGQSSTEPLKKKSQVKQNAGVQERAKKDVEETVSQEEIDLLQKSRTALEKKAKIYENLTDGNIPDDEVKELYLVDFQRKVLNKKKSSNLNKTLINPNINISEENKGDNSLDETVSNSSDKDENLLPHNPDEDWVDYTDSLGRSRRCLKKDLPELLEMDKHLKKSNKNTSDESEDTMNQEFSDSISSEFHESVETPAEPVHYQTVQHNEIRSHGVGYFSFSTEEEERQAQMENLNQLREQTIKQRSARERLKEKRKAILKARLNKVKKRKNIEIEESDNESISDEEFDPLKFQVQNEDKEDKVEKPPKIRPWDIGKILGSEKQKYKYTQESWIEERRTERIQEFAPPSSYNKKSRDYDTKVSNQEESNSSQFSNDKINLNVENLGDRSNDNNSLPSDTPESNIERMIAETVTYFRKQTE